MLLTALWERRREVVPATRHLPQTEDPGPDGPVRHDTVQGDRRRYRGTQPDKQQREPVLDYFAKWPEVYAIPNQETSTVADNLVICFICRVGVPRERHGDQRTLS
jgi:hypothetical protein